MSPILILSPILLTDQVGARHFVDPLRLAKPSRSVISIPKIIRGKGRAPLKGPKSLKIAPFAERLFFPRNLAVAPNGDVFVVEAEGNRVTALRDADGDGKAETKRLFVKGLNGPHGIAFFGPWLYVANTDRVIRYPYRTGQLAAEGAPQEVVSGMPAKRGYNMHWTRNIAFSPDGTRLFVTVGSGTNDDVEPWPRGSILSFTPEGKDRQTVATGLRNPVGLALRPGSNDLWASVIERDFMGGDCPPDYLAKISKGEFYGWPWFYIGKNRDPRHRSNKPPRADVKVPEILVEAHSIPLGLHFYSGRMFSEYRGDLFVAMRGSTNRVPRSGYKIVRFDVANGGIDPRYEDFIVGWVPDRMKKEVWGRPVAVGEAKDGALLIVDESAHTIWRVSRSEAQSANDRPARIP